MFPRRYFSQGALNMMWFSLPVSSLTSLTLKEWRCGQVICRRVIMTAMNSSSMLMVRWWRLRMRLRILFTGVTNNSWSFSHEMGSCLRGCPILQV